MLHGRGSRLRSTSKTTWAAAPNDGHTGGGKQRCFESATAGANSPAWRRLAWVEAGLYAPPAPSIRPARLSRARSQRASAGCVEHSVPPQLSDGSHRGHARARRATIPTTPCRTDATHRTRTHDAPRPRPVGDVSGGPPDAHARHAASRVRPPRAWAVRRSRRAARMLPGPNGKPTSRVVSRSTGTAE